MGEAAGDGAAPEPNAGDRRIAQAFAQRRGRAALMPYLMGGFPDMATSRSIGEAHEQCARLTDEPGGESPYHVAGLIG